MKTITKTEPNSGEVFEYLGMRVQCVKDDPNDADRCVLCAFYGSKRCATVCCAEHEREKMIETFIL